MIIMVPFFVAKEVRGRAQKGGAFFVTTVKTLSYGMFRKMLVLDVPLPTVLARKCVFPLTRTCFFVTPPAKGAIKLGFGILGGFFNRICKGVFLIYDKFVDL
jgi:hypothetical protein